MPAQNMTISLTDPFTVKTPKIAYSFTVGQQKYHPYITLSTATTNANLDTDTPEVCVGQQVTLTLNGLPSYQEQFGHWTLPPKHVNEAWQVTNWVVTPPLGTGYWAPVGSVNYRINPDLKTNLTTQCWYVNRPGGKATAAWNLQFSNGQQVDVITRGKFSVRRPTVDHWDLFYLGAPQVMIGSQRLGAGDYTSNSNGMSFKAWVQSADAGKAGFTQLISGAFIGAIAVSTDGIELDQTEWSRGQQQIATQVLSPVPTDDQPSVSTAFCTTAAMDLAFTTYLRFRPSAGNPGDNIFVTLRAMTWFVNASATSQNATGWQVDPGSSITGPYVSDSDQFPVWVETFNP
jgi:hypothetical protein